MNGYGVHLPLIDFDGRPCTLRRLLDYADTAKSLRFVALAMNDHLLFSRLRLDGPTALAPVLGAMGHVDLIITVALPIERGPVALDKSMAAIDILSGAWHIMGVGPGSSARDYEAVGVPFVERWKRLDEAVKALRALWHAEGPPYEGEFDSTKNILLELRQSQQSCPPTWIGSWGFRGRHSQDSPPGRRLASAYNTTPEAFADVRARLGEYLRASGKDPDRFPNAFAAVFFHVTEDTAEVDRICRDVLGPTLRHPGEEL